MNTCDKNASSDSPPSAVLSAASLYGASFQGLKLNKKMSSIFHNNVPLELILIEIFYIYKIHTYCSLAKEIELRCFKLETIILFWSSGKNILNFNGSKVIVLKKTIFQLNVKYS